MSKFLLVSKICFGTILLLMVVILGMIVKEKSANTEKLLQLNKEEEFSLFIFKAVFRKWIRKGVICGEIFQKVKFLAKTNLQKR